MTNQITKTTRKDFSFAVVFRFPAALGVTILFETDCLPI